MVSSDSLTIEMSATDDPHSLPLEAFGKVVSAIRAMLKALDETKVVEWRLGAISMQSPCTMEILEVAPKGSVPSRKRIDDFMAVVQSISDGNKPPKVPKQVIAKGRTLIQTLNTGLKRIKISSPGRETIIPLRKPLEDTRDAIRGTEILDYSNYVQLEGNLRVIGVGLVRDQRLVQVVDRLTGQATDCMLSEADFVSALDAMKNAPSHVARVTVFGKADYCKDRPTRMKVERLEVFPVQDDEAVFFAVQGIDLTGGIDSVDFVRGLWND